MSNVDFSLREKSRTDFSPSENSRLLLSHDASPLRVRFEQTGDRYRHTIEARDGGEWRAIYQSLEGNPGERFPPSPPLQNLSIEELAPGRRAALLVGMAGTSHWSLSIEFDAEGRLIFDAACRFGEEGWLGSSYTAASTSPRSFQADTQPGLAPQIVLDGDRITLAAPSPASAKVRTVRWRYRVM